MTTQRRPLEVGSEFGPYRLVRLIGRGGMGEVYQAYDTGKDRVVAIKVLPERLAEDPVYRERFRRESHAAARLKEPHVIPIHDYGEIDGHLFIDMRLVEGENLRALLRTSAPLPPADAVELIRQVAAALDAAHADDLVHRDIKPDNILTTPGGFAYLVDFGIAHSSTAEGLTGAGSAIGSFHYMAPERFTSRVVTPAADIYALGCVLYECLTGARPFPADTDGEVMRAHLVESPPRPSRLRDEIPRAMDAVIARALAKEPAARYGSAGEFAAAAQAALCGPKGAASGAAGAVAMGAGAEAVVPDTATSTGALEKVPGPFSPPTADASTEDLADTAATPRPFATDLGDRGGSGAVTDETGDSSAGPPKRPSGAGDGDGRESEPPKWTFRRVAERRAIPALIAAVILAAATVLAAWVVSGRPEEGTAVADDAALRQADVDLVASAGLVGYKRANCAHREPDVGTEAVVYCDANDRTGAPTARLFRFSSLDWLREYYKNYVVEAYDATNCPNDPPGVDGPLLVDGKPAGRDACLTSRVDDPAKPKPVLAVADEDRLALGIYVWDGPEDQAERDYVAARHLFHFLPQDKTVDPDFFTSADRRVLDHLTGDFGPATCKHVDVPGGMVDAFIRCGTPRGAPSISFLGFPDDRSMNVGYQAALGQTRGHACDGSSGGADDVWRKASGPVGRFFCYTDESPVLGARDCLMAVHDDFRLIVDACALSKDDPDQGPKSEGELLEWFEREFGQ
ncbi:serine/threonine-protein kinase [Nocardia amikacinitolerans]|uniref:serine/threonine-protein kinase n=1 Tax=Nocardia amikacinitolerans TaxID=756689 RepID=UPI0020A328A5|nr:serine/threonine-protein kinase [Nocardia amikacinitolerans]MCP2275485.1 serine/threonine protein kinase [Nocardia amikacinitolerans]